MKRMILILLLAGFVVSLHGQEDTIPNKIVNNIATQLFVFPQEKVYLHTDKPYYINGENIFFRIFLLDALSNRQDTLSRYVYVELINDTDSIVRRVKIRPDENYHFYGTLSLPENLQHGIYKVRAYTQYMQNQGESSFFWKQVRIGDPEIAEENLKSELQPAANRKKDTEDFDVTFYPEGGQLITGQMSNMAFKALSPGGNALDVVGEVVDSEGNKVARLKTVHNGMGDFSITPLPDEHYRAICRYGELTLQFDLPRAEPDAIALKTFIRNNKLRIAVNKSESASLPRLYLLIHSRGSVVYAEAWDEEKDHIAFDTSIFPSGINHILLLTEDLQIVSERLVFLLNNADQGVISFQTTKKSYRKREEVQASIQLKDQDERPLKGNFSIAVTNDRVVVPDTTSSILSGILLTSELRGQIQNPEYYFRRGNKEAEWAADLLMRTHGWTRYALPDVIRGKITYPDIPFERSQQLSGVVKSGLLLKPAEGFQLTLIPLKYRFLDQAESDENGRYIFHNFEFPDSTEYVIQALNRKGRGRNMTELYIDEETFPGIELKWIERLMKEEAINDSIFQNYVATADKYITRMIDLPEITISAARKEQKYKSVFYSEADFSLTEEKIKQSGASSVENLFYQIPGVLFFGNSLRMRGFSSVNADGPPLILFDGVPISMENLSMISVNDIGQLDVIKDGAKLAIYGFKGVHGVIEIHSKKGEPFTAIQTDNIKSVMPLGFQLPIEFYSPKYDSPKSIDNPKPDFRTTIYWKPNVLTDDDGNAEVSFYTADDATTYSIIVEGVSEDGRLVHYLGESVIGVE